MPPAGNWSVKYWTARGEVKGSVSKCKGPESLRTLILSCLVLLAACSSTPDNSKEDSRKAAETNASLARSYMDRGQYEIALEKLKRAVAHDKTYAPAHTLLAILYETIGEDDQAEKEYKMAVKYDPEDGDVNNNYGAFLCARGKSKEAERYFMTAVKDPFYSTPEVAYANAGSCALEQDDLDKAEIFLRQSLGYNDQLATALLPMAEVSYRKGAYLQARAFLQRYESVAQMTEESLQMGFRIESELGDQESASRYRTELLEQFPGSLKANGTASREQ
jgi:type IV pilus assembly protein PilF